MGEDDFVTFLDCEKRHRALDSQMNLSFENARSVAEDKAAKVCQQAEGQMGLLREDIKTVHKRLDGILTLAIVTLVSVILTLVTIFAMIYTGTL